MNIKRGQIFYANLDPSIGGEIKKTRPVIVVSNDINNKYNLTVSILPITSNVKKEYPFEVIIDKGVGGLPKKSKIKADQIRTIDKSRLIKVIGILPVEEMDKVNIAMKTHLNLT